MPKTILVADDSATIRRVVQLAFGETDVRVESAAGGREALARLHASAPDLVLADVVMPEPSGYEICRNVKRSRRPVPVLLLADAFEPFDAERAKACGADGYMVKPFETRELLQKVTDLLSRPLVALAAAEAPGPVLGEEPGAVTSDLTHEARPAPAAGPVEPAPGPVEAETVAPEPAGLPLAFGIPEAEIDAIAEAVVRRLTDRVLREIAWEVVPEMAEVIIRERLGELERKDPGRR